MASERDIGILIGLLVGEGHFGGDGRQPQITLRMHVRHEALFRWLERTFPGGRLYGPYEHGGRRYYQWMVRGEHLRELLPTLQDRLTPELDAYAHGRLVQMCDRYRRQLRPPMTAETTDSHAASPRARLTTDTRAEGEPSGAAGDPGPSPGAVAEPPTGGRAERIFRSLRHES